MNGPEYHYVLTIACGPPGRGTNIVTHEGLVTALPGTTVQNVYRDVYTRAVHRSGMADQHVSTMFWSLTPNKPAGEVTP